MRSRIDLDLDALKKEASRRLKAVEVKANAAAERHSTPKAKAAAFAKVLKAHGLTDINMADLETQFTP